MWFGMPFAALTGVEVDPFIEPPDVVELAGIDRRSYLI